MSFSNHKTSMAKTPITKEIAMKNTAFTLQILIIFVLAGTLLTYSSVEANQEMTDLNQDMQEYLEIGRYFNDPADRFYISDMAAQNIYKQWAIWNSSTAKDENLNSLLGSSYTRFIILHYYLNSPSWVEWGLNELETFLPAYKSYIDSTTEKSYGTQLDFIESEWLTKFSECNAFNELLPPKKLIDNPIWLKIRAGCYSDEDKYVLHTAERYLNKRLGENKEYFYFYVPVGEYQVSDQNSQVFPKEFTATADTANFIYLTPNYKFNFVPIAEVFSDDGVRYDTLSPSEFELIKLNEGRSFEFENLEFGRYLFKVKPPYKLVDRYPNKLIIPKEAFGADYLKRGSELFDKAAYDKITIANGETLVYMKVERVKTPPEQEKSSKKKKK